jgi:hypothetical protein
MGVLYISHSQLDLWLHCPRKWEYKYIKKIPQPTTAPLIEGSVYHKVLETYFNHKLNTKQDLSIPDVYDAFSTHWTASTAPNNHIDWGDRYQDDVRDECQSLLTEYVSTIAPQIIPAVVEETYISDIEGI